jgi:hypothetical protein
MTDRRIADINAALGDARGGQAALWDYMASLAQLTIRITWRGTSANVHLVCNGCSRLEASMGWDDVNLVFQETQSGEMLLTDERSRFLVRCARIRVFRDVYPKYLVE